MHKNRCKICELIKAGSNHIDFTNEQMKMYEELTLFIRVKDNINV